jgi:hypothetical protein
MVVNHSPLNVMKMTLKATKLPFQYCNALSWQHVTLSVRSSVSAIEPWRCSHSHGLSNGLDQENATHNGLGK